jgi:two-component system response regulator YesN
MNDGKIFTVVVVEDEKLLAKNITKYIETVNSNFKVIGIETNGEDALKFIKEQTPNVIFTDIQMPIMDGIELIRQISEYDNYIKCVVLSGHDDFAYAQSAIEYIEQNYHRPIDLNHIAEHFYFSPSYLTKIFTKYTKVTPSKYILHYRIHTAMQLLGDFNLTINMVANMVGYTDPFHFSKSFKQVVGMSPANYREELSKNK